MNKARLRVPGPTEVPERVLSKMAFPMINHRGDEFRNLYLKVCSEIKYVFQTENDVLIFPSAGTGVMEAAISNFFSPGDIVVSFQCGVFGERFAEIAKAYGANVEVIKAEYGMPITKEMVRDRIKKDKNYEIKGILFTQNETSTGVLNDIKALKEAVGDHPALIIVDAISSLGAVELKTDEWGIDVVVSSSQKAFMLPPGLGFISISEKAWKAYEYSKMPKYYFDIKKAKNTLQKGETPYTPFVSLIYALEESLKIIKEEGLENIIRKHKKISEALRAGIKAIKLKPFVKDDYASPTVTAVEIPEEYKDLTKTLKNKFNITVAGGQGSLKGKIMRIGHLGYVDFLDIIAVISALEMAIGDEKLFGKGIKAAEKKYLEGGI